MQSPQPTFELLAAGAIARRWQVFRTELDRLIADPAQMEAVHQVRVAGRRLRVALRGVAPALPPKKSKRWAKDITRLTRDIGRVRDADVQLQFVDQFIAAHTPANNSAVLRHTPPAWLTGVKRLRLRLSQQRDRQVARIDRAIARFADSPAQHALPQFVEQPVDSTDPELIRLAEQAVAPRVDELLAFSPYVEQPQCVEELHRMRIAAKHLRYTLELYEQVLRRRLRRMLTRVRKLQTLLGDVHDCDMWIAELPRFIDDERQRMIEYQGNLRGFGRIKQGVEQLLSDRRSARSVCYLAFVGYWHRLMADKTFQLPKSKPASETLPADPPTAP